MVCKLGPFVADLNPRGQITRKNSVNRNWRIGQSIWYGTSPVPIMDFAAGTVDTGNTLILLVTGASFYWIRVLYNRANNLKHPIFVDTFDCYRRASGEVNEPTTKLLRITPARYANLKSLLTIGDRTFELTAHPHLVRCAQRAYRRVRAFFTIGPVSSRVDRCRNGASWVEPLV